MAKPEMKIVSVDLPELSETFADSVEKVGLENGVWRLDFSVTRLDEPQPPVIPGKRYPACRLVLTMNAALDLHNKLKGIFGILEKQGLVTETPAPVIAPGKPN